MFIVRILPIARGIFTNELSFFSRESYEEGALLQVPVRGKTLPGIVLSSKEARQEKTDLKSAGFALKKIPHLIHRGSARSSAFSRNA